MSGITLSYIRVGLIYLIAGPVLLLFSATGLLSANRDAFFVMELYGFVTMAVFGISYFFVPGIAYGKIASIAAARIQLVIINIGTIVFTTALSGVFSAPLSRILTVTGLMLILVSVLIHASNLWVTIRRGLKTHDAKIGTKEKTD